MKTDPYSPDYPDEWGKIAFEAQGAKPVFVHKRLAQDIETADKEITRLIGSLGHFKAKQFIRLTAIEELENGWACMVGPKDTKVASA